MAKLLDKFVSVVLVGDEHSKGVAARIEKTAELLKKHYANYEVVLVASGLAAEEIEAVKAILPVVPCIRMIRLAKPKDVDTAIFAGVEAAIGDNICILYNGDPIKFIPYFVSENEDKDIIFGVATNLHRKGPFEKLGARLFYWYNRKYLKIDIPRGSTYYVCINRNVANALTSSDRTIRHFRHLAKLVGFSSSNYAYFLP
jgi:dolichol-phosphate mannosyltransferase